MWSSKPNTLFNRMIILIAKIFPSPKCIVGSNNAWHYCGIVIAIRAHDSIIHNPCPSDCPSHPGLCLSDCIGSPRLRPAGGCARRTAGPTWRRRFQAPERWFFSRAPSTSAAVRTSVSGALRSTKASRSTRFSRASLGAMLAITRA